MPAIVGVAAAFTARALARPGPDRRRAIRMAFVLAASGLVIAGLVKGRGRMFLQASGPMDAHQTILAVPLLCWAYFALELFARPAIGRLLQMALLALALTSLGHFETTLGRREWQRHNDREVIAAIRAGATPEQVAAESFHTLGFAPGRPRYDEDRRQFVEAMGQLRDAGIEPYRSMGADAEPAESPSSSDNTRAAARLDRRGGSWQDDGGPGPETELSAAVAPVDCRTTAVPEPRSE